ENVNITSDSFTPAAGYTSAVTKVTFIDPVFVNKDNDYCIAILDDVDKYACWVAKMGEVDKKTGVAITKQPDVGTFFESSNNITWSAAQDFDLKYTLRFAQFGPEAGFSSKGTLQYNNVAGIEAHSFNIQ